VITVAELLLLLAALIPVMGAGTPLDSGKPAHISYLWWAETATKPMVFVIVSLIGGALGGALHAIASLTAHVTGGDFGGSWTMWYLTNPVVGAALATIFLFVLQAGLGGQAAPTTGGLYGIAAVATLSGLFSRHALNKLKDIFDVASGNQPAGGTVPSPPPTGHGQGQREGLPRRRPGWRRVRPGPPMRRMGRNRRVRFMVTCWW